MLFFIFIAFLSVPTALCSNQAVTVTGRLLCGNVPYKGATVKLYDEDLTLDDLMAEVETDNDGRFTISGTENEISTVDAKVNIYHDCADGIKPCQRRLTFYVPSDYIVIGSTSNKPFNFGELNLEAEINGETRDCLHR